MKPQTVFSRRTMLRHMMLGSATALLAACTTEPVAQPTNTSVAPTPTAAATSSETVPTHSPPSEELFMNRNGAPTPADHAAAAAWLTDRFVPTSPNLPFSFTYGDQPSSALLPTWTFTEEQSSLDANRMQHRYVYTDPASGLEIQADVIVYSDYPAVEWVLYFHNTSSANTPIIAQIQALDAEIGNSSADVYTLHYAKGSTASADDFAAQTRRLVAEDNITLTPNGGRSSDGVLPFFNVERPNDGGVAIAVGWSGQWQSTLRRDAGSSLRVQAGLERTHLTLYPGERIRTPRMMLMFWQGDRRHAQNMLRRVLLAHYSPQKDGKALRGPIWASSSGDVGFNNVSEENQLASAQALYDNKVPLEYWQMDAGWFEVGWPNTGSWEPDPNRFPRGLKPIGDRAHELGFGYILWYEPERVTPGTRLYTFKPEWLLTPADLPQHLAYQTDWRLFDLGNPEALAWMTDKISAMNEEYGVDIYRHDFNMHPLYNWRSNEPEDRLGMREIRYIEGFYAFWDELVRRKPGLYIDNSASGGRRLDLETITRSIALFRTDYFWVANADQDMTYALAQWLPMHAQGIHAGFDTYTFRSGMGTSYCMAYNFPAGAPWEWLRVRLEEYKRIREYFYGDFYPLVDGIIDFNIWIAYQFDRPDLGEGMVMAFRREGANEGNLTVTLDGLEPDATYSLEIVDTEEQRTATGAELMSTGLTITLDSVPLSALVIYRKAS